MAKYSLINVSSEKDGLVSGYWIQNHIGTIDETRKLVLETWEANGGKIDIAIVDEIASTVPSLGFYTGLKRI